MLYLLVRPICTSVDEIVAKRLAALEEEEVVRVVEDVQPLESKSDPRSSVVEVEKKRDGGNELDDFQSLIQCFPKKSLDSLYLNFLKVHQ